MKQRKFLSWNFFTVFNFSDDRAKGRCIMLFSSLFSTVASSLCMGGTLYTAFLTANNFSIVDTGILSFLPPLTVCISLFSPVILERFPKRKWILTLGRTMYYSVNIIGFTLLTYLVKDQSSKLIGFCIITVISNTFNALISSGYTVWHLNFIPNDVRMNYFSYSQIISSLVSGAVLLSSGLIADSIRGTARELPVLLILRIIGYAFAVLDIIVLASAKEYPYPSSGEKINVINTFRLPFRNKKFLLTMMLIAIWCFGGNLTSTWNYYLINNLHIKITVINIIDLLYGAFLLLLSPFGRKILSKFSWFNTFAVSAIVYAISYGFYGFIASSPNPTAYFVVIRLIQHAFGVTLNLSWANFPYINMPRENQTYYLTFYTFMVNIISFFAQMCATLFLNINGDHVFRIFGFVLEGPAFLLLFQGAFQLVTSFMIFALRDKISPDKKA